MLGKTCQELLCPAGLNCSETAAIGCLPATAVQAMLAPRQHSLLPATTPAAGVTVHCVACPPPPPAAARALMDDYIPLSKEAADFLLRFRADPPADPPAVEPVSGAAAGGGAVERAAVHALGSCIQGCTCTRRPAAQHDKCSGACLSVGCASRGSMHQLL